MNLSDLLFEDKNDEMMIEMHQRLLDLGYNELEISRMNAKQAREIITNKEKPKKYVPVEPAVELAPGETVTPESIRRAKSAKLAAKRARMFKAASSEPEMATETEPEPDEAVEVIDDAQDYEDIAEGPQGISSWIPEEPKAESKFENLDKESWQYGFENRIIEADTLDDYLALLKETHDKHVELYKERNQDNKELLSSNARKFQKVQAKGEEVIGELFKDLEDIRAHRKKIVFRLDIYAPDSAGYDGGDSEATIQRSRDNRREHGLSVEGVSEYEKRILNLINEVDLDIIDIKNDICKVLRYYPPSGSGFGIPLAGSKEAGSGRERDPTKQEQIKGLYKIFKKAISTAPSMFVDDPDGYDQYIEELKADYLNYEDKLINLVEKTMQLEQERYKARDIGDEDKSLELFSEQTNLSAEANKLLAEFREKYDPKEEKSLDDSDFRDQNWYSKQYRYYMAKATTLPGAPASIDDSLRNLTERNKFTSSATKYPDINQVIDDKSLINQVIRGVRPLAHVKTFRRQIKLTREETQQVAYVLAPEQMGGGVIWYRPAQTAGERPYNEKILGYDPEDKKETTTKPYNPLSKDANLNIVELYIWNNIANRSDPRLYNFINGLCLGYPRDYVIWFCESKHGEIDHRQPERSFWGRMLDRFRYCVNAGVNGYGRPGNIEPDGMFSKIFKSLTPNFIDSWVNKILGTKDLDSHQEFASAVDEFDPVRAPEKTEFKDQVIESIFNKLDSL